jgi:hypothetical protein
LSEREAVIGATPASLATSCKVMAPELRRDFFAVRADGSAVIYLKMINSSTE